MGTNFYLHKKNRRIHIGKQSFGWRFLFRANRGLKSFKDYERALRLSGVKIVDEYGTTVSANQLLDGIEEKEKSLCITATYNRACPRDYFLKSSRQLIRVGHFNSGEQGDRVYSIEGNSVTLSAHGGGRGAKMGLYHIKNKGVYRKLHPIECERLQGVPDDYTLGVSNTKRYQCLGNAFNVDVVAHILSYIKE